MAAALNSPSSSPIGTRIPPAQDTNGFTAFPLASYIPTVPMSPSGLAEPQAPGSFLGTAAGMTPGKPAAQTPRRAHRTSKVRSPVAAQPTSTTPVFDEGTGQQFSVGGSPQTAAGPSLAQEPAAGRGEEDSLPQQFAQTVNLGPQDWPPSARKPPPPTGGGYQRTPILTPGVARRSAQANRARRPTASAGRTPAATESPFVREGSPMDWSPFVDGSHASSAAQTPNETMGKAQHPGAGGTRLSFEQRADAAAIPHTVPAPPEPAEDEADGLHVDLAATKISCRRVASGTTSSSLAADFSELFKFGTAPAPASEAAPASPRQPSQQDTAEGASAARPTAAAPAEPASVTAQSPNSGSSGSFSTGFMNGAGIGVRPSGTSRLGGRAAADRDIGRRATKTDTPPSRGHGEEAKSVPADVIAKSKAKFGGADVRPRSASAAAAQPPLSHRMGVPENDRARANQEPTKPAPAAKPVQAPAAMHDQEAAVRGNTRREASASPEDADMRDASPGQSKAESKGSAADSSAPFGFTEAAMPAGVKLRASEASKAAAQATPSQAEEDLAARLAAEFRASMDRCKDPEELANTIYNKLCSERAAHGGRKLHKGMNDEADASTGTKFPSQSNDQKGQSSHESGSQPQAQVSTSQQGADSGSFKANGFTLGAFSKLQKKKPPAAAATRAKAAIAKQEPAFAPGHGENQTAGVAPDSTKSSSLSDVWRTYAQELQAEKAAAAAEAAGQSRDSVGGAQASGNVPGSAQTPVRTASTFAPAESSSKSEAMGSTASFVTARSSPEVELVPDLAETLLKKWEAAAKEQRDTKEEESLASKLRQQTLGESEDADAAASAGAGAAAAEETSTVPPADQSEQPTVSFAAAAQGATFGFGQAPTVAPGASFGLGQAPKAPRGIPRRSRGRARAAPSRPHPAQPASTASQPPSVPEQTFFTSTQSSTPDQPTTTEWGASHTAAQGPQQGEPTMEQQPIFGFHSASGSSVRQQASEAKPEVQFGWPASEAAKGSSEAAPSQAQTWSFGPKPFKFKSPGSKVRAPSAPRSPQPSGFSWGQPPPAGVPFAKPPSPPQPASAAEASAGAPTADWAPSGGGAQPPSSFATAKMRDSASTRHMMRDSGRHDKVQGESTATTSVEFAGVQPVRVAVFPPNQVPQSQDAAADAGTQAAPQRQPRSPLQDVERLRQRGNDAFQRGSYARSVDLYQRAVDLLRQHGISEGLGKLYSNLAASYLQMDKPYAAIAACNSALQAEPSFFRARLRMATCRSRLGDLPAALGALGSDATSAANVAEAAGKRADLEALQERFNKVVAAAGAASGLDAAESALSQLEALLAKDQAPFSSTLHRLRAQLLLQLGRKEEADDMCSVCSCSREPGLQPSLAWPWWLRVQCAFHSGDIQKAAAQLESRAASAQVEGQEEVVLLIDSASAGDTMKVADITALAQQLRSLLESKEAGNRAIKEGKADVALQHYNAALAAELPGSADFVAVLYANRAAAHQSLGQCTLAVADCLRATALNPTYSKAHSRLAAVLSELKHRAGEADALERLQALPSGGAAEAAGIAQRLRAARAAARNATPDHYKVLGVARDADSDEVRRAYKKSALQLHPDKALVQCRFSDRLGPHGVQLLNTSQVQARVRDKADWLFKCVGAAHAALTDPAERRQLDADLAAQEGRASTASYYSNFFSQPPTRSASYSSPSSYYYGRKSDTSYSRRKAGNAGPSAYTPPRGFYYDSYPRRQRQQKAHYGGAGSDDSDVDEFDYR